MFKEYAVANRFDCKEVVFFKRILQAVLPEEIRSRITEEIFEKVVGIDEQAFAKELYMNYDQLRCLKEEGMHIGLHGYDHYWLNKLDGASMMKDVDHALECMSGLVGERWVMNYPYGSYSLDVIDYVKKRGCSLGLSTDVSAADISSDRWRLPRLDTNDFPPKSNNYIKF